MCIYVITVIAEIIVEMALILNGNFYGRFFNN